MQETAPYIVVLDANIWVAERLLQSSIGNALLYALAAKNSKICLPEVVELEVQSTLQAFAERAIGTIAKEARLLRQLSGQKLQYMGPTSRAINEGINERWKQLEGVLHRIPFSFGHARAALNRVILKRSPSGDNNEQFRDCCIWESMLDVGQAQDIHLVTGDGAFYDGRDRTKGLAAILRAEAMERGLRIFLHPNLGAFMAAAEPTSATFDEGLIRSAIVEAVLPKAGELAGERGSELRELKRARISGYATPKQSAVAVSFDVSFSQMLIQRVRGREERNEGVLELSGNGSYDPNTGSVSEITISEWSSSIGRGESGFQGTYWSHEQSLNEQYLDSLSRVIT